MKRILTFSLFILHFTFYIAPTMAQDRGFIHPGGLHTQADFDRVKQQLKDNNETVTQAYNVLKQAAYSQSSVQTSPVETIVRGGGSGENYINAARGATMAYQNALRWKIDGTKANADAAVRILMAWANTTKAVTGNSDAVLALGLYGYQFAQAAELMRDYEGWAREDFANFQRWMLTVWYPGAVTFLRYRNGTWENSGKWWQAPGHYWSNWGLCCALCVASIGVLCDDVYIYNQGMSFFKYDQVGTYEDPRTANPIQNNGLTDFLGNLVVTTSESELETGAYGQLGQMNESGRDTGHPAMALGLAIDLAKMGWNQGDDLFAYMHHRLAAGIEYIAAQVKSVEGLPWTNYHYATNGYYYTDSRSWLMEGPALGVQIRPCWGTVIGIYEGVKGVTMPYSEQVLKDMGIDGGGQGATSGGYDQMGYSVLMNTRVPQLAPADQVPTELSPKMEYSATITSLIPSSAVEKQLGNLSGKTVLHNELGGLVNSYNKIGGSVPNGQTLTLMPQLPEGEEDTGMWQWNTGETTRDITVTTDRSYIYRVTYTNSRGIESQLCFPIACETDGMAMPLVPSITYKGETTETDTMNVLYGSTVKLAATPLMGGGTYRWSNNRTTESITTSKLTGPTHFTVTYKHTSGVSTEQTFRLDVHYVEPYILIGSEEREGSEVIFSAGSPVVLGLRVPTQVDASSIAWSNGATGTTVTIEDLQTTTTLTATFEVGGQTVSQSFTVFVAESTARLIPSGDYLLRHVASGRLLTSNGKNQLVTFEEGDAETTGEGQVWFIDHKEDAAKYNIISLPDSLKLSATCKLTTIASYPFYLDGAEGSNRFIVRSGTTASTRKYWDVDEEGQVVTSQTNTLTTYPFELIPASDWTGIEELRVTRYELRNTNYELRGDAEGAFDLSGRRVSSHLKNLKKGIYIVNGRKVVR